MQQRRIAAYLVHAYTASSVVLLLASAVLLFQPQPWFELSLFLMLSATFIDATDGTLARIAHVKEYAPAIDGRRMDDVIDYVEYVFLPVLFMIRAGLLMDPVVLWGSLPLLASAFGFAQVQAKIDEEGFFVGFPSYWNICAFYLFVLGWPTWMNTLMVTLFSVLVFVPTRYLYITRFPRFKLLNYGLAYFWGATIIISLFLPERPRALLLASSLIFPVYYTIYSLRLDWQSRQGQRPAQR